MPPRPLIGYVAGFDANRDAVQDLTLPPESQWDRVHTGVGEYVVLGRAGDRIGAGQVLGGVYDVNGNLMYISNDVDFQRLRGAGHRQGLPLHRLGRRCAQGRLGGEPPAAGAERGITGALIRRARKCSTWNPLEAAGVLCYGSVSPLGIICCWQRNISSTTPPCGNHPDNYDEDEAPRVRRR